MMMSFQSLRQLGEKTILFAFTLEFSNQFVGLQDRLDYRFWHF